MYFKYKELNFHSSRKQKWMDGNISPQILLIYLLLGKISPCDVDQKVYLQNLNYFSIPPVEQSDSFNNSLFNLLISNDLNISSRLFFSKINYSNSKFYLDILAEFHYYFHLYGKKNYEASFLFLYRIMERFSYAIPLLYSRINNNYYGSFESFKKMFTTIGNDGKEIGFFSNFIKDNPEFLSPYDPLITKISFNFSQYEDKDKFIQVFTTHCSSLCYIDEYSSIVEVEMKQLIDFFVTLRNRIFHYRFGDGKNNIKFSSMKNPQYLFKILSEGIANYLAIICLRICIKDIQ